MKRLVILLALTGCSTEIEERPEPPPSTLSEPTLDRLRRQAGLSDAGPPTDGGELIAPAPVHPASATATP